MTRTPHSWLLLICCLSLATPAQSADVEVELDAGSGFVIQNNGASVERMRVDEATGNVSRNGALFVHTTGTDNIFVGEGAGTTSTSGSGGNSAFGKNALSAVATGYGNSGFGKHALISNTSGSSNSAFGHLALQATTLGDANSAFGARALEANLAGGNSAFGAQALGASISGLLNSAFGAAALLENTSGSFNSAFGYGSLRYNTTAYNNSAFGSRALLNNTGGGSTAFGAEALRYNTTGNQNVAIGYRAGRNQTTGSDNIYIANDGVAAESGQIKIGTDGTHTDTFLVGDVTTTGVLGVATTSPDKELTVEDADANGDAVLNLRTTSPASRELVIGVNQSSGGLISMVTNNALDFRTNGIRRLRIKADGTIDSSGISGHTVSGVNVLIDTSSNELGIAVSSARFKREIEDLEATSEVLRGLRPVSFRYRESEEEAPIEYGLIAEEVAAVAPELVIYDAGGRPYSVRYHLLAPLLLNELQEQQRRADAQERRIAALMARVAELERGHYGEPLAQRRIAGAGGE